MLLITIGGVFLRRSLKAELEGGVEVETISHEQLGFLSGHFRESQHDGRPWTRKEGFAIVILLRRLEYLWEGVRIYTDQCNLAYISEPEACVLCVPKTAAQRLEKWKMSHAQYVYTIMHIFGERNCWGDLLSRWVNVPVVTLRAVAVFASSAPDETIPSKDANRGVQQEARTGLGAMFSGASLFPTVVGRAIRDNEDFSRSGLDG